MSLASFLLMGVCFGISALGLWAGAVGAFVKQQRTMAGRIETTGTVVELTRRITTSGRANIICPVVEFSLPSGETVRFTSDFGSLPARHQVGQQVDVGYDPVDPHKAEIKSAANVWLAPVILIFMGAVACCLAISFVGVYALGGSSVSP